MPAHTTTFTATDLGYSGRFFDPDDRTIVEVDPLAGWILIHNRTVFVGSNHVKGGIWIGAVRSDPDVAAIGVDVTLTFRQAHGILFGLGYATAQLEYGVMAIDEETDQQLDSPTAPEVQDSGVIYPWFGGYDAGPLRLPDSFTRRFVIPKPSTTTSRWFLIGFFLNSWTGGGPAIEADLNAEVTLDSVLVLS